MHALSIKILTTCNTSYIALILIMNNFSYEFTPTESSADGTVLYIANHLSYKPCPDLNIYKK